MKTKYEILLDILDAIRGEAAGTKWAAQYAVGNQDVEKMNQARSRALIHLFLQVMYGLTSFSEREHQITDGNDDGGIDAYHFDTGKREIIFIQSKFRATEKTSSRNPLSPKNSL